MGIYSLKQLLMHDPETFRHSLRVAKASVCIGRCLNLPLEQMIALEQAAMFHDVGKIYIPKTILHYRETLSPSEWDLIRQHPQQGADLASQLGTEIVNSILSHHEFFNGKGYPKGLTGSSIPLFSRIIAIADAYDAMTSARPYRKKVLSKDEAVSEIQAHSETQFDPYIVEVVFRKRGICG